MSVSQNGDRAEVLLEIDIDSAQEDPSLADVGFIRASGGVGRNQMDLMTSGHERRRQGIVPETAPAVHGAGTRCNECNLQMKCPMDQTQGRPCVAARAQRRPYGTTEPKQ